MQYKLLSKVEADGSAAEDDSKNGGGQFKELLGLCKSDLNETLNRLKSHMKSEALEDQLRKELLD